MSEQTTLSNAPGRALGIRESVQLASGVLQAAVDVIASLAQSRCAELAGRLFVRGGGGGNRERSK